MTETIRRLQINMPFSLLKEKYLPMVLEKGINPEIGIDCFVLDNYSLDDFAAVAEPLHERGLTITLHGPFYDLRPGALDRRIREATAERIRQFFEAAPFFRPKTVVFHASYEVRHYFGHEDEWLANSRAIWSSFISAAEKLDTTIVLENVYEDDPRELARLFACFKEDRRLRCCFDTGHFNCFSNGNLPEWLDAVGPYIGEVHLHDNDGSFDWHQPVGEGTFPFNELFHYLRKEGLDPVIAIEPHTEKNLWKTLENIDRMHLL